VASVPKPEKEAFHMTKLLNALGYIGLIVGLVAFIVIGSKQGWLKYPPHP
jgi:hypothetical protein